MVLQKVASSFMFVSVEWNALKVPMFHVTLKIVANSPEKK